MPSPVPLKTANVLQDENGNLGTFSAGQVGEMRSVPLLAAMLNQDESGNIGVTGSGSGGTTNHAVLSNRDLPDQHPIESITGLTSALDKYPTDTVRGTYAEIKSLRDQAKLIPGSVYEVDDYETIYRQIVTNETRSDSTNLFNIRLLAIGTDRFAPEAWAAPTERTQPTGSVMSAAALPQWRLLYDIDNNQDLYEWATPTGKGVIYGMEDHLDNSFPYDAYNVKFRRYLIEAATDSVVTALVGKYASRAASLTGFTVNGNDYQDYLTVPFSTINYNNAKEVKIGTHIPTANAWRSRRLNNIVFQGAATCCRLGNSAFDSTFCESSYNFNSVGYFYDNIFGGGVSYSNFDQYIGENRFGGDVSRGAFRNHFASNNVAGYITHSGFGPGSTGNTFMGNVTYSPCLGRIYNSTFLGDVFAVNCGNILDSTFPVMRNVRMGYISAKDFSASTPAVTDPLANSALSCLINQASSTTHYLSYVDTSGNNVNLLM